MSFLSGAAKNDFQAASAYAPGIKATTQNFQPAIDTANTNYGQANSGFNSLAASLQQQMNGGGPNLANAQLQSATAQNVGNQAAMMAGQRGASANAGLMARQVAQQGAGIQQQAAGQAAQNVLQQQLAAQGQLGNVLNSQGSLANQNLGIQQNAQSDQNKGILSDVQGRNTINADTAKQNTQANAGMLGGIGGVIGKLAPLALGAVTGGMAPLAMSAMGAMAGGGGDAGGLGGMAGSLLAADGGSVDQMQQQQQAPQQPMVPQFLQNFASGQVPQAMSQPMNRMAQGGLPFMPHDYRSGGQVVAADPKQKATKPGNNYANDKIPAMLSEKEVVLPREVTQSPNAPQAAAQFMAQVMAGKHRK